MTRSKLLQFNVIFVGFVFEKEGGYHMSYFFAKIKFTKWIFFLLKNVVKEA